MNRMPVSLDAALGAVSMLAAVPGIHAARPILSKALAGMAQTDPEHARLTAMCGTWDVEMTFWLRPGGAGLTRWSRRVT